MRKRTFRLQLIFIFTCLLFAVNGFSFAVVKPVNKEPAVSEKNIDYLKASVFVTLSAKEFTAITGRKLNLPQKLYFKIVQRRLKHELKKNPDLLITEYYDQKKEKFKFDILWFVICGIIGPLGIVLVYTGRNQKDKTRFSKSKKTSAWLGFAFFVLWFGYLFVF